MGFMYSSLIVLILPEKGVTGLERPEVFGLPAGVQLIQEIETGQQFLTALATVGGAQTLQGTTERSVAKELKMLKKMVRQEIVFWRES